jgi:hypothetical protein
MPDVCLSASGGHLQLQASALGVVCRDRSNAGPYAGRKNVRIVLACGFALALLGTLALETAAQTSCSGWNATCRQRCNRANCPGCDENLAQCKKTGCWQEWAQYGGKKHCNLKK